MKLYLIRHGDAEYSTNDTIRPLSPQGELEAKNAGRYLLKTDSKFFYSIFLFSTHIHPSVCLRYLFQFRDCELYLCPSSQNATALAAATFNESTPWDIGIFTV